jgi:hypothetical protein
MRGVKSMKPMLRLAVLAAGLASGALLASNPAFAELRNCQIARVAGEASLSHDGKRAPAEAGMALGPKDQIRTGGDGRVEILCSDQTTVTIGAETEINLGSLVGEQGDDETIAMSLHRGIARFLAPVRTWGTFNVFGPVAVASVRSTEWVMETPKRGTNVLVLKGRVEVRSKRGDGYVIGTGYGIDVARDGTVGEPKQWGAERVARTLARVTFP